MMPRLPFLLSSWRVWPFDLKCLRCSNDFVWFKSYCRLRGSRLLPLICFCCGKSQLPTENPWTRRASVYCIQGTSPCCHQTHLLREFLKSWLLHSYFTPNTDIAILPFHVPFNSLTILPDLNSTTVHTNTIEFAPRFQRRRVHRWSPVMLVLSAKLENFDKTDVRLHVQRTFMVF